MPKLSCRCGYVHDLSPIPDNGFRVMPAWALDRFFSMMDRQPELWEVMELTQAAVTSLYACPNCEAVMWDRGHEGLFMTYLPTEAPYQRIYAVLDDRDPLDGVWLRHPRTVADIQAQRLLLRPGVYIIVHDDRDELYARVENAVDPTGNSIPDGWVARPLAGAELAAVGEKN